MPTFTADYVYPIASPPIKNGIVELDDEGRVIGVYDPTEKAAPRPETDAVPHRTTDGILIPGFVNAHCHLELSHLRGRVDTGTGLLPFLVGVVSLRETEQAIIDAAIVEQDAAMWAAGIQAVGDICNKLDTAAVKRDSPIHYYSFVEHFDFLQPERAAATAGQYAPVYAGQPDGTGNARSAVPHAPYTVSDPLYRHINALNTGSETVSIHNQETPAEDELFRSGGGPFAAFFAGFGASLEGFTPNGRGSIFHALERMDPEKRTLFVHNTLTTAEGIAAATDWGKNGVYWATCPNANLYIENRLPNYALFLEAGAKVCVGTDSLTSNWQLSILEELRAIHKYQSYVPFAELLRWATLNGAEALQFDDRIGSLEVGKTPGLLALTGLEGNSPDSFRMGARTQVQRLH